MVIAIALISIFISWFFISRLVYIFYISYVQNRTLETYSTKEYTSDFYPHRSYEREVLSWDFWSIFPFIGDVLLLIWLPFYVAQIISYKGSSLKEDKQKRIKVLKQQIQALEKSVKEHEPESLVRQNKAMLNAIAEVEMLTKERV